MTTNQTKQDPVQRQVIECEEEVCLTEERREVYLCFAVSTTLYIKETFLPPREENCLDYIQFVAQVPPGVGVYTKQILRIRRGNMIKQVPGPVIRNLEQLT